jgi:acyl-CoA synthetase (AMP-forming)/AMP-acid ligase II
MIHAVDDDLHLYEPLAALAAQRPDVVALRETSGAPVGYAELFRRVTASRDAFRGLGMTPGEQVLFSVRPGIDAVALALAICGAGGVIVPCDPGIGDAIFSARLAMLDPRWVVAESRVLAASSGGILSRVLRWRGMRLAPIGRLPNVRFVRVGAPIPGVPRAISARALASRASAPSTRDLTLDSSLPALVEFTSGTTGSPKAVVHTRRSMAATLATVRDALDACESDTVYSGALHLILPALCDGARVVIPRRSGVEAHGVLRDIERWGVSHLFSVASDSSRLVDYCVAHQRRLPASLRVLLLGGSPVHVALLRRLREVLAPHTRVVCIYGMTEILPVARVSLEEKLAYEGTGDLLGTLTRNVHARIADDGELLLRGPGLFDRYLGGPPVTEHATGDLARIEDGRLVLLGRAKDMIIRGETNIYPELYEPLIERIRGVRRCALVGLYRERLADEYVVLVVEPEPGVDVDELRRRLPDELRLGDWRIDAAAQPDFIVAMSLPEVGRSSKVDKAALRALVQKRPECV